MTYRQYTNRQCTDQAERERYGFCHFHLARAKFHGATITVRAAAFSLQYYLRTAQKYYPHF